MFSDKDIFCTAVFADPQTTKNLLWNEGHMCLTEEHMCKKLRKFKSSGHAKHTTHVISSDPTTESECANRETAKQLTITSLWHSKQVLSVNAEPAQLVDT